MKKRKLTIIVIFIAVIFILWYCGIFIFNYPFGYDIRGIDVSAYQGDIDWDILSSYDIDFVFIKATEGSGFVDEKFDYNCKNAAKTDLKLGAYHFFSFDSDGETQAENFIKNVPKTDDMLPPVIDVEFYAEKKKNPPKPAEVRAQLSAMLDRLEAHYGKRPIIYAAYNTYNMYIADNFDNPIWIRDVYFRPHIGWTFWQYTDKVRLKGYTGREKRIDMNVFNGSYEDLEAFTEGR